MEYRERLFERIARGDGDGSRNNLPRYELLSASIRAHLDRLLKTRKGSVPLSEDYGIPDFSNIAGSFESGTAEEICQAVAETVSRWEKRLLAPRVRPFETTTELATIRIEISGEIVVAEQHIPVHYNATVRANGEIVIAPN